MPRRVRVRAVRGHADLDPETLAALSRVLPPFLQSFLLNRDYPPRGTAEAALLDVLTLRNAPHYVMLRDTPLKKVWRAHRKVLLAQWAATGHPGQPFGALMDRDPFNPDPRGVLKA